MWTRRQGGVTLVELIIAIVILAVAVAGMVAAFNTSSKNSADPLVTKQLTAIAEGMMEEITLKPFDVAPNMSGASGRDGFTDARDFDGYGADAGGQPILGITDVSGTAIPALANYSVVVSVKTVALTGVPAADALLITVTVTNGANFFVLTGWRTRYA